MSEPMRISPIYTVDDWKALTFANESDWQKAVEIFKNRIRGRFLNIIDAIENRIYAGFAVLALDCLLIETLQQFRKGVSETPRRNSTQFFVDFLTNTSFGEFFTTKDIAEMFYNQIRCGILHQAEVKSSSLVRIREGTPLVSYTKDGKGRGRLLNKRMVCNKKSKDGSGKANLVDSPWDVVWGVLYEINPAELDRLDKAEGGYQRMTLQVLNDWNEPITAEVYVSTELVADPTPYDWYKKLIIAGAYEHQLPKDYLEYLEQFPSKPNSICST